MENIIGLVLCGGKSSRMGSDKGLLTRPDGKRWSLYISELLAPFTQEVYFSINNTQDEQYSEFIEEHHLIIDQTFNQLNGTLQGILSAHLKFPENNFLLASCDLQLLNSSVVAHLHKTHLHEPEYDVLLFKDEQFFHPTMALYTKSGLAKLHTAYKKGLLNNKSMHFAIHLLNAKTFILNELQQQQLKNFNNTNDIIQLSM